MIFLRLAFIAIALVFGAMIGWAINAGDFGSASDWLTTDPWGVVTLADLYIGLLLSAVVIVSLERSWRGVLWIVPLPFLGNLWTLIWFAARFPLVLRKIWRGN